MFAVKVLANGVRTDHPVPGVGFVDDGHIPVEDRLAVEAIGRGVGHGMWGREDTVLSGAGGNWSGGSVGYSAGDSAGNSGGDSAGDRGWVACTTDPLNHDLAWVVRFHPRWGRSVWLVHDEDWPGTHMALQQGPMLWRAGGYWFDGVSWYRPEQIYDRVAREMVHRVVPSAVSITAADQLHEGGDADKGVVVTIQDLNTLKDVRALEKVVGSEVWLDDLALWARLRGSDPDGDPGSGRGNDLVALDRCLVDVMAPELTAERLVDTSGFAEVAGISAGTLRAYIARDEASVPAPQKLLGTRALWSRKVAEEWAEARRHDDDALEEAVAEPAFGRMDKPAGIAAFWERLHASYVYLLWDTPRGRRRWALRWRNRRAVDDLALELSWEAASRLQTGKIIPFHDLAQVLRQGLLWEISQWVDDPDDGYLFDQFLGRQLGWLIQHAPDRAESAITNTIDDALTTWPQINRDDLQQSIRLLLARESDLPADAVSKYTAALFGPRNHPADR